jgi:oxygen-independent coproporphyrinogen-3 oxidase
MRSSAQPSAATAALPGLYVHVPFCRTKCIYCDFYSVTRTGEADAWLSALGQEIALYKDRFSRFDSLYIGGGTPTCLDERRMSALFEKLHEHFRFSSRAEITIEANPDDMDGPRAAGLIALGINRLSLGVQSFNDKELAFLRRRHTAAGAEKALEAATGAGFSNIGIDLMYGLPGQTQETWLATLKRALSFNPSHLSCYELTPEGETPLSRMVGVGRVHLPGEEEERDFFLNSSRFLEAHGFTHYEVSNFAASEKLFCRHNRKYWTHVEYLGLGPAAHSFDGTGRWWNHRSLERYCKALARGMRPVEGEEVLSREQLELERLYLGLRTRRGVRLPSLRKESLPAVRELKRAGLVSIRGDRLCPTRRGYLVADSLPVLLEPA